MSSTPLVDARLMHLLVAVDRELAAAARAKGCSCGGTLHSARYPRKPPKGLPEDLRRGFGWRESLCCEKEGCRKRTTPPSVRFLGRRGYPAALVVLVSAMEGGVTERRAAAMREFGVSVSVRTLQRWRAWWLRTFPRTVFWRGARGVMASPVDEARLPASLLERFVNPAGDRLIACLRFLAPITTGARFAMVV